MASAAFCERRAGGGCRICPTTALVELFGASALSTDSLRCDSVSRHRVRIDVTRSIEDHVTDVHPPGREYRKEGQRT